MSGVGAFYSTVLAPDTDIPGWEEQGGRTQLSRVCHMSVNHVDGLLNQIVVFAHLALFLVLGIPASDEQGWTAATFWIVFQPLNSSMTTLDLKFGLWLVTCSTASEKVVATLEYLSGAMSRLRGNDSGCLEKPVHLSLPLLLPVLE